MFWFSNSKDLFLSITHTDKQLKDVNPLYIVDCKMHIFNIYYLQNWEVSYSSCPNSLVVKLALNMFTKPEFALVDRKTIPEVTIGYSFKKWSQINAGVTEDDSGWNKKGIRSVELWMWMYLKNILTKCFDCIFLFLLEWTRVTGYLCLNIFKRDFLK